MGRCIHCAQTSHGLPCTNPLKCANCGAGHAASSNDCVRYKFEAEVLAIRDSDKVSFQEARRRARNGQVRPGVSFAQSLAGARLTQLQPNPQSLTVGANMPATTQSTVHLPSTPIFQFAISNNSTSTTTVSSTSTSSSSKTLAKPIFSTIPN
ncbi:unnamed protein product, partial [Rotaria socialis]